MIFVDLCAFTDDDCHDRHEAFDDQDLPWFGTIQGLTSDRQVLHFSIERY